MKRAACLGCLSAILLTVAGSPAQADPSYPLTCHASSTFRFGLGFNGDTEFGDLNFRPTNSPAAAGVPPGYCAWSDRGFRSGEPTTLSFPDLGRVAFNFSNGTYSYLSFSKFQGVQNLVRDSGQYFVFQVHREGRYMRVDRIGP